ncbi:hypothetical protein B0B52_18350 [Polaromonas sp. A23]|nr:hypothetical protein B0B52_18350 [Polaromonas sp. A23]
MIALLVVVTALNGCSLKLQIALFNNVGELLTVRLNDKNIAVESGQFAQFDYPGDAQMWMIRLSVGKCEYVYQVPKTLEHYPWSSDKKGPLKAQIERNFDIFLLPPQTTAMGVVAKFGNLQQDGFPLHPVSKICH